jgi:hypothetical protein
MATNIEGESEVVTAFSDAGDFETQDGPDGKQVNLGLYISAGGGVGAMLEDDYFYDNMAPAWAQASLTIKQLTATVSLSGRVLRRAIEGPAAFATWAEKALPEKAKRLAFHRDRMLLGTGTGIIGRISGTPDGTGDQINAIFGVAGLGTALNSILRDDLLRYSPNANGSSPRAGVAHVTRVAYAADTFDTDLTSALGTPAIPTSAAANDYVFLGSANVNGSGSRELMGLEGHLDDGTNVSTYQGLTRSSYPDVLYAQIVDSTTSYGGNLSEDLIDYTDALCYERAGGKPDLLLAARNGGRSFWKSLRGDRVLNDPQGAFQGGKASLRMLLGDRVVEVRVARKIPSSRAYLIDRSVMKRFKIGSGRWDDVTGSIWNRFTDSTGQKDAVTAYWVQEEEYASFFPARCAKITGLAAA